MITRTQAIANFLKAGTHDDLANLYNYGMECQVNVAQDGGERTAGEYKGRRWNGWTDGIQTWKPFRIPRNANSNPEYEDTTMTFSLQEHAEGIGMTGWDWQNRASRWVAFDFDAIAGHKEKHSRKLDDSELEKIKQICSDIPWVTVRKSAGGKGLHLYVFLDPAVPTANHNEHAALARAILGKLAALTGFDFYNKVDICGQNMWVWHRKMKHTGGLALIKQGSPLSEIPLNWKDHVKVVSGHRNRSLPAFVEQIEGQTDSERIFLELMGQVTRTPLDEDHKRLIKYLEEKQTQTWWDADHHILITHTHFLKDAHTELSLKGIFETEAKGTEAPHDHNCFLHPIRNGGWIVRRYSMGVQEHPSWDQDGRGYTRCYFNRKPDLGSAARAKSGIEIPSGGFVFQEAENAVDVAKLLGTAIPQIPVGLRTKKASLKKHNDGRLIVEIEGDTGAVAAGDMQGWLHDKGKWKRIFGLPSSEATEIETPSYDNMIRHVITEAGDEYGWMLRDENTDKWHRKDLTHITAVLKSLNIPRKEIEAVIGNSIRRCWTMVSRPFQPEYVGDRLWNRGAAQLRFVPSQEDNLEYPTWNRILEHCGKGLDDAIRTNAWAKNNGIVSGAEYLKVWLASLIKEPLEPLPYLFFYGPQDAGKSIFHEAVSQLFTKGYQRADVALINPQGFNQELEHAVLCVVEEINLRKNAQAGNRIKDWVTARQLPIHKKGKTPYHVANTTHWVQCANESTACPTFPGDTRITMIYVDKLDPTEKVPKRFLLEKLEKEAADFLGALKAIEIPPSNDRLNVPMIITAEKIEAESANRSPLQVFLEERCYYVPGSMISKAEFYEAFMRNTEVSELQFWPKTRLTKEMPPQYPSGRSRSDGHHYFGNISFKPQQPGEPVKSRLKSVKDEKNQMTFLEPEESGNGQH